MRLLLGLLTQNAYLKKQKYGVVFLFPFTFFFFASAHAGHIDDQHHEPLPSIKSLEKLDSKHEALSNQVLRFANWIDNFFADERIYNESQESQVNLSVYQTYIENDKPISDAKLKAKLIFPKTQKKLQLLIESDEDTDEDTEQPVITETDGTQDQSIGLRFIQSDIKKWKINTDVGMRYRSGIETFARFRMKRNIQKGPWSFRFSENIFGYSTDGMGETTRLDIDRSLTDNFLFRSTTQATWKNSNDYFDLSQDLFIFQDISKRKAIAYQLGVRGRRDPQIYATDHIIAVRYREQIHQGWLFLEITPKINHLYDNDYKPTRSITLKLEAIFGDI